jgi:hypothetical protein
METDNSYSNARTMCVVAFLLFSIGLAESIAVYIARVGPAAKADLAVQTAMASAANAPDLSVVSALEQQFLRRRPSSFEVPVLEDFSQIFAADAIVDSGFFNLTLTHLNKTVCGNNNGRDSHLFTMESPITSPMALGPDDFEAVLTGAELIPSTSMAFAAMSFVFLPEECAYRFYFPLRQGGIYRLVLWRTAEKYETSYLDKRDCSRMSPSLDRSGNDGKISVVIDLTGIDIDDSLTRDFNVDQRDCTKSELANPWPGSFSLPADRREFESLYLNVRTLHLTNAKPPYHTEHKNREADDAFLRRYVDGPSSYRSGAFSWHPLWCNLPLLAGNEDTILPSTVGQCIKRQSVGLASDSHMRYLLRDFLDGTLGNQTGDPLRESHMHIPWTLVDPERIARFDFVWDAYLNMFESTTTFDDPSNTITSQPHNNTFFGMGNHLMKIGQNINVYQHFVTRINNARKFFADSYPAKGTAWFAMNPPFPPYPAGDSPYCRSNRRIKEINLLIETLVQLNKTNSAKERQALQLFSAFSTLVSPFFSHVPEVAHFIKVIFSRRVWELMVLMMCASE